MVAQHDGIETLLEPSQRLLRVRTAINEVPDAEEPVEVRIERDCAQSVLKGAEAAMHISDDEVAARLVEDERGRVHVGK